MIYSVRNPNIHDEKIEDKYLYSMDFIYAHYKLQELLGYDSLATDTIELISLIDHSVENKAIITQNLEDNSGNVHEVKLFLWKRKLTGNRYTGLVCLPNDTEALKDAEEKYNRAAEVF